MPGKCLTADVFIRSEGRPDRRYLLKSGERFVLGRGQSADIHVEDRGVSRNHVALELREGRVYITDLGSRNGTYFGSQRLAAHQPTPYEQRPVRLGEHVVEIRLKGGPSRPPVEDPVGLPFLPPEEFEILGEAGRGGLAMVWIARQKLINRKVAIKVLRAQLDPNLDGHRRFLREARLYTQVKSPHVVELFDVRLHQGSPYLILELVEGPTAKGRLRAGTVAVPEALRIGEDVARALTALAQVGIVHRDVKPSNILITLEGRAKLADFGLAKHLEGSSFTHTDMGLGSLPYVAPEQATGAKAVDIRSDLYSLGATIYHLLAGKPPLVFAKKETLLERVRRIQSEPPLPPGRKTARLSAGRERPGSTLLSEGPGQPAPGTRPSGSRPRCTPGTTLPTLGSRYDGDLL